MRYIIEVNNEKIAEYKTHEQALKFINTMINIEIQYNHPKQNYKLLII